MSGLGEMQFPRLQGWQRNLLILLVGLYVLELLATNQGWPVQSLAWHPIGQGFAPFQLLTHLFVQGASVQWVVLALLVVYFLIAGVASLYSRDQLLRAFGCATAFGLALAFLVDATGIFALAGTAGWGFLTVVLVLLYALGSPDGALYLFFVVPVPSRWLVWGSLGLCGLGFGLLPSLGTLEALGAWAGTLTWYYRWGPGARRRALVGRKREVESELAKMRRFRVIEGGRTEAPQGDQDDIVH